MDVKIYLLIRKEFSFSWLANKFRRQNVLFVNYSNFFISFLDVSFLRQKGIPNQITSLGASKWLGGIIYSTASMLLSFCLNILITFEINFIK